MRVESMVVDRVAGAEGENLRFMQEKGCKSS